MEEREEQQLQMRGLDLLESSRRTTQFGVG